MPALSRSDVLNRRADFVARHGDEALRAFALPDAGQLARHEYAGHLARLDFVAGWMNARPGQKPEDVAAVVAQVERDFEELEQAPAPELPTPAAPVMARAREGETAAPASPAAEAEHAADEPAPGPLDQLQGLDLVPLRKQSKAPRDTGWRSRVYTTEELADWLREGGNLGARVRPDQLVLDWDPRSAGPDGDGLERFARDVGLDLSTCPTTRTPSGGLHLFLRIPAGTYFLNTLPDWPGLEFKGYGRQVVAPPSIHPLHLDGPPYMRDTARPSYDQAPDAPEKLLALAVHKVSAPRAGHQEVSTAYLGLLLGRLEPTDFQEHDKWLELMMACHAGTGGDAEAAEVFITWSTSDPSYAEHGESIRGRWDSLDAGTPNGVTVATLFWHVKQTGLIPPPPAEESFDVLPVEPDTLEAEAPAALTQRGGKPEPTNRNTMLALDALQLGLAMDTRAGRVVVRGDVSDLEAWFPNFTRVWSQESLLAVRALLIKRTGLDVGLERVQEAAQTLALREPFDPVAEWLDGLQWDGTCRLDGWLVRYAQAEDSDYVRAVGRRLVLAAVARALVPGIKFDSMTVLEGPQGAGKSSLVRVMGGDYAVEDLPRDVAGKDCVDALRTAWWAEVSELASMRRAELDAFKSFVSRQVDRARLAYERETRDFPRRCVLVGTTNQAAYLQDLTGARRFWPVAVGTVDLVALARDREQLYAEAVAAWKADPRPGALVLPEALWPVQADMATARTVSDPWLDTLERFLEQPVLDDQGREVVAAGERETVTSSELFAHLGIPEQARNRGLAGRLAAVMQALGWDQGRFGHDRTRGYRRRPTR